jgi:hypothetical protein
MLMDAFVRIDVVINVLFGQISIGKIWKNVFKNVNSTNFGNYL